MRKSLVFSALVIMASGGAFAVQNSVPLSKYSQIQNVQNYSSNPFWNKDGPYNQKFPTAVYAQGTDLNASDCQSVVASLVAVQCMTRNNCANDKLSDIRPAIMVQLSRMPGHNYASSCAGYIDAAFDNYRAQYSYVTPGASFPTATTANPNANPQVYKPQNPYEVKLPAFPGDPWAEQMLERKAEMKQLQAQNGANEPKLQPAQFEATAADLSFAERMQIAQAGYEPFKDKSAYTQLKIEDDETYIGRIERLKKLQEKPQPTITTTTTNNNNTPPANPTTTTSEMQRLVELIMQKLP